MEDGSSADVTANARDARRPGHAINSSCWSVSLTLDVQSGGGIVYTHL
jgi:hypothetical protein